MRLGDGGAAAGGEASAEVGELVGAADEGAGGAREVVVGDGEGGRGRRAGETAVAERDAVAGLDGLAQAAEDQLAGGGLGLVEEVVEGEAGEQRVADGAGAGAEGDEEVLRTARVLRVAGLPLGAAPAGAGVGVGEEEDGALGALVRLDDAARDGAGKSWSWNQ